MPESTTVEAIEVEARRIGAELRDAYPLREAAEQLRRSKQSMYIDVAQGRLRVLRVGHKLFVPKAELFRILLAARG